MSRFLSTFGVSRLVALALGSILVLCLSMMAGAGFLKYRLDSAEAMFTMPSAEAPTAANPYRQLSQAWGYAGFVGLAQKYVWSRDNSHLDEMRNDIAVANDIVEHLPESTSDAQKQELRSLARIFETAFKKLDVTGDNPSFTSADLVPLYGALPVLETLAASVTDPARPGAQKDAEFWSMLLAVLCWFSSTVAAASVAGIYLAFRDRHSSPMRALAQSIKNMSQGDMRSPIWGLERQDMIGELARAIDLARYRFSHLPDVSLLSDQGPVRLRFEGESRSLFEAMMKSITTHSETIREQSTSLTSSIKQQKESIGLMSTKVEAILQDIAQHGSTGDKLISQAIRDMVGGAEHLKNAHAHAADQLSRLIPVIQERAKGLGDITQITGKQLTHTLQSLASSEITLKANAEKATETLSKLSSSADDLGERLFGAINLLQASGKVLGETTENIKSNWNSSSPAQAWNERLDQVTQQLASLQAKLDVQTTAQLGLTRALEQQEPAPVPVPDKEILSDLRCRIEAISNSLTVLQSKLNEPQPVQAPTEPPIEKGEIIALSERISELSELNGRVAVFVSALPGDLRQALKDEIGDLLKQDQGEDFKKKLDTMESKLSMWPEALETLKELSQSLSASVERQSFGIDEKQKDIAKRLDKVQEDLTSVQQTAEAVRDGVLNPPPDPYKNLVPELEHQFVDQWSKMSAQLEASRAALAESLSTQIQEMENGLVAKMPIISTKTTADYALQVQIEKQTEILAELVSTLSLLDAHVQKIHAEEPAAGIPSA